MRNNLKLKIGDRVEKIGPEFTKIGLVGTVVGYNLKSINNDRECYWVTWDEYSRKSRSAYHVDFLELLIPSTLRQKPGGVVREIKDERETNNL